MKLKPSTYNIIIDKLKNEDTLLFNSFTCAFGIMESKYQFIYENIEKINIDSVKDREDIDFINIMKDNGFFVDSELDEKKLIDIISNIDKYDNKQLNLCISPTLNCNMECLYCFEKKSTTRMSQEIKQQLIEFIENSAKNNKISTLNITWFGGEPLLELSTICELTESFKHICDKMNINYNADIITNGYLLNYDTAKLLSEQCSISSAQITIDGLKNTHNKRRNLKNKKDSFSTIVDNILKINELINISVRINVDKENKSEIVPLIKYLLEEKNLKNKVHIYPAPVSSETEYCCADKDNLINELEFVDFSHNILNDLYNKGYINIGRFIPSAKPNYCGACRINQFAVDPEGNLYKCWETIGQREYSIGNLSNDFSILNSQHIKWVDTPISLECQECKIYPLCVGGCILKSLNHNKNICDNKALAFTKNLKVIYENYISKI